MTKNKMTKMRRKAIGILIEAIGELPAAKESFSKTEREFSRGLFEKLEEEGSNDR